jgi:NADH-quinone oxidoreductase subunit M
MAMANLILILLVGGVLAIIAERLSDKLPRMVALAAVLVDLLYLLSMLPGINPLAVTWVPEPGNASSWIMHWRQDWIPAFGISIEFAMDGLSLLMVALTLVLGAVAVIASWTDIRRRQGFFNANLLWTLAGVLGVFLALDLFLFFLFWEVMLIPMYFMIAIWGHENRGYAAMKFFIFTQASGLLMLVAILVLAAFHKAARGYWSFSYFDLLVIPLSANIAPLLMLGFFIAFVVKLPAFPFHTWLPDAHTQAPTAGSVILAGILLKTGAYGLIRFAVPLFPEASLAFAPFAMALGAAGVIYGAILAFGQTDFKRLVAYSSVSHMGFVLLGVYAWNLLALQGAVMQMVAHGFSTAALFMIAGSLQERLHTRDMGNMGGLWHNMPRMGAVAMFFVLASLGLPGLGNFVAEFLVLLGLFQVNPWMAVVAALGMIVAAAYSLILMQKSFQGTPDDRRLLTDFGTREMFTMAVMMVALVLLGVYPQPVLDVAEPVLQGLLNFVAMGNLPMVEVSR